MISASANNYFRQPTTHVALFGIHKFLVTHSDLSLIRWACSPSRTYLIDAQHWKKSHMRMEIKICPPHRTQHRTKNEEFTHNWSCDSMNHSGCLATSVYIMIKLAHAVSEEIIYNFRFPSSEKQNTPKILIQKLFPIYLAAARPIDTAKPHVT